MITGKPIIAYRLKGEWYSAAEVEKARVSDKGAFWDALPYTLAALQNRAEYKRDVPDWIKLDDTSAKPER